MYHAQGYSGVFLLYMYMVAKEGGRDTVLPHTHANQMSNLISSCSMVRSIADIPTIPQLPSFDHTYQLWPHPDCWLQNASFVQYIHTLSSPLTCNVVHLSICPPPHIKCSIGCAVTEHDLHMLFYKAERDTIVQVPLDLHILARYNLPFSNLERVKWSLKPNFPGPFFCLVCTTDRMPFEPCVHF